MSDERVAALEAQVRELRAENALRAGGYDPGIVGPLVIQTLRETPSLTAAEAIATVRAGNPELFDLAASRFVAKHGSASVPPPMGTREGSEYVTRHGAAKYAEEQARRRAAHRK